MCEDIKFARMIVIQEKPTQFSEIRKGSPFAANITIYSKSGGVDIPKQHIMFKTGNNKATTADKRIVVHFLSNTPVNPCVVESKRKR